MPVRLRGFSERKLDAGGEEVAIAKLNDIPDGDYRVFALDGFEVGLFRNGSKVLAYENVCPHAYALLTQGFIDGDTVECPLHEAVFHIQKGKCMKEPGGRDLKTYAVRLAGEEIQIKVE